MFWFGLFLFFVGVSCSDDEGSLELIVKKNLYDIPLVVPDTFTDKNFSMALGLGLDTFSELEYVRSQLFSLLTYDFGLANLVYDPTTTGYLTSVGQIKPLTVYDPDSEVTYSSKTKLEKRIVAFVGWFVSFNSSGIFPGGNSANRVYDQLSGLIFGNQHYLRNQTDYSKPQNNHKMFCHTQETAKYFPNQYVTNGFNGGFNSVIKFRCVDSNYVCDFVETNTYKVNSNGKVDELKRSVLECPAMA